MRDFNFFSAYGKKRQTTSRANLLVVLIGVIVVGLIVASLVITLLQLFYFQKEINSYDEILSDPSFQQQVQEANKVAAELTEMESEKEFFIALEGTMTRAHKVNERFMRFMGHQVVQNLFLTELIIEGDEIRLAGSAKTKAAIAQFEYDLRNTGNFRSIRVPEIERLEKEKDYYGFQMVISGRDVMDFEDHPGTGK